MKKIIMSRGAGKTTALINLSAMTGDYIVCRNLNEASRILAMAQDNGLNIPMPITYAELVEGRFGKKISGFLIEDIEEFLSFISSRVPVNGFSI